MAKSVYGAILVSRGLAEQGGVKMYRRALTIGRKARKGFTLIEWLVVIAIIAILVVILPPGFARAHENPTNELQSERLQLLVERGGLRAACTYVNFVDLPQYKANLHCHSRHSDGSQFCDEVASWYKEHGYQVLAITDHDAYGDQDGGVCSPGLQNDRVVHDWDGDGILHETREKASGVEAYVRDYSKPAPEWVPRQWNLNRPGEFVVLNGMESSFGHPHTNVIGCPAGKIPRPREGYGFIDWCHAAGGVVFLNHPASWNKQPANIYNHPDLRRIDGLEVMNGFLCRANPKTNVDGSLGFAEPLWNACLDTGKRLWGFANDDAHTIDTTHYAGAGSAWNMIWARELTVPAILESLHNGAFYASCGIIIDKVTIGVDTLTVHSPNATHIEVIGDGGRVLSHVDASQITYKLAGDEKWIRVVLWNDTMCYAEPEPQFPQKAWMQPIMLNSLLEER